MLKCWSDRRQSKYRIKQVTLSADCCPIKIVVVIYSCLTRQSTFDEATKKIVLADGIEEVTLKQESSRNIRTLKMCTRAPKLCDGGERLLALPTGCLVPYEFVTVLGLFKIGSSFSCELDDIRLVLLR